MSPKFFGTIICRVLKLKKNILKKEKEKEKAKHYSWAKGAESESRENKIYKNENWGSRKPGNIEWVLSIHTDRFAKWI